jgi:hypothetical protein
MNYNVIDNVSPKLYTCLLVLPLLASQELHQRGTTFAQASAIRFTVAKT